MGLIRAQARLAANTNIPEDVTTNTFHYIGVESDPQLSAVANVITAFYISVNNYLSPSLSGAIEVVQYAMSDPEPREPISVYTDDIGTVGENGIPQEVALCISYKASPVSGSPPARRRGRIYLGPLSTQALGGELDVETGSQPNAIFLNDAVDAFVAMVDGIGEEDGAFVVYSPTSADSFGVVEVWADNEWDTQRRRGRRATSRVSGEVA